MLGVNDGGGMFSQVFVVHFCSTYMFFLSPSQIRELMWEEFLKTNFRRNQICIDNSSITSDTYLECIRFNINKSKDEDRKQNNNIILDIF